MLALRCWVSHVARLLIAVTPFFLSASILFGSWFSERSLDCVKPIATVLFLLSYIKENTDGKRRGAASQFTIREEMVMKWKKRQQKKKK